MTQQNRHQVAIVGAGFSGLLTAINLLKLSPHLNVALIERRPVIGPGAAYDTDNPHHLLNVRLDNMGAFPDRPTDLSDWLATQPGWRHQDGFIARGLYGDYLKHLLRQAQADAPGRLTQIHADALSLSRTGSDWALQTSAGPVVAQTVVLALGNLEPGSPLPIAADLKASSAYVENPWALDADAHEAAQSVLLIGAGLTMVDAALTLQKPGRRFVALSRHGLPPRAHAAVAPAPYVGDFGGTPSQVFAQVRAATRAHDWRGVFDRLRQLSRGLWQGWTPVERRRFLRHLRTLWDIHRHRLSPVAARQIQVMQATGALSVQAGRLTALDLRGDAVQAAWRPRGQGDDQIVRQDFDLVINCTGPLSALSQSADPFIRDLLAKGYILPDPLGLGLWVDDQGRPLDPDGRPVPGLNAVGPMTRGALWEITAVPDLRGQARALAERLTLNPAL